MMMIKMQYWPCVPANGRRLRTRAEGRIPPPGSETESAGWTTLSSEHPVVRTHPETGRKSLFLGGASYLRRLKDMTEEESRPLIQYLSDHAAGPEFTCRFRWRNN